MRGYLADGKWALVINFKIELLNVKSFICLDVGVVFLLFFGFRRPDGL